MKIRDVIDHLPNTLDFGGNNIWAITYEEFGERHTCFWKLPDHIPMPLARHFNTFYREHPKACIVEMLAK